MYKTNVLNDFFHMIKTKALFGCPKVMAATFNVEFQCIQFIRNKTHYTSLGLDSSATSKDIKSAYYDLSLKFHPDKNNDSPESVHKFREIAEAYEVLGNPEKKRVYDRTLSSQNSTYRPYDNQDDFDPHFGRQYRRRTSPYTGKTKHYDYDEHFRKHYENFYKTKEANEEEFRRRWQGDRRFRYGEEDAWARYKREAEMYDRPFRMKRLMWNPSTAFLFFFWSMILISTLFPGLVINPDNLVDKKTVYYKVKEKKSDT